MVLSYADDVAMVVSGPNHMASARLLLRRLTETCASLGLVINRAKTKAMAFGHRHLPEPLELDGTLILWTHRQKYLGMEIDSRLKFGPYVTYLRGVVERRTNVMRALARTTGGASDRVLRRFYVQAVRSRLDYGEPCLTMVTAPILQPLETAQNAALRVLMGTPM